MNNSDKSEHFRKINITLQMLKWAFEAESVAYTVCQHYGIDTSDYSFAYVATWSQGKEMPELKESLNTIREAAADLITKIDAKVQELTAEKEPISFYVAECGEFHSMGEFHENLTL